MAVLHDAEAIRARNPLSTVIGRFVELKRAGKELVGLCPFHQERTPSFHVNDPKGTYYCFGCHHSGDVFTFLQMYLDMAFPEACDWLSDGANTASYAVMLPARTDKADKTSFYARRIWEQSNPNILDTPVRTYLGHRGIDLARLGPLPNIRFARLSYDCDGKSHPVLVGAYRNAANEVTGIQRIYLRHCGARKLDVQQPKKSLGVIKGSALHIGDATERIVVCEGLEDGLSIRIRAPHTAVWATGGTSNLASITLPTVCRSIIIAADNDDPGIAAAIHAAETHNRRGMPAEVQRPGPDFKDWNDELRGIAR
jgi:DNA primase